MNLIKEDELKEGCYYQYHGFGKRLFFIGKFRNLQLDYMKGYEGINKGAAGTELIGEYSLISKESFFRMKRVIESRINKILEDEQSKM